MIDTISSIDSIINIIYFLFIFYALFILTLFASTDTGLLAAVANDSYKIAQVKNDFMPGFLVLLFELRAVQVGTRSWVIPRTC